MEPYDVCRLAAFELTDEPASPDGWKPFVWLALGAVAYFVLRRSSAAPPSLTDQVLSLVWPAAGVAMLLFGLAPQRWWSVVLGADRRHHGRPQHARPVPPHAQAGIFVVSNIAQAICAVLDHACPGPAPVGRRGRPAGRGAARLLAGPGRLGRRLVRGRRRRRSRPVAAAATAGRGPTSSSGGVATPPDRVVFDHRRVLVLGVCDGEPSAPTVIGDLERLRATLEARSGSRPRCWSSSRPSIYLGGVRRVLLAARRLPAARADRLGRTAVPAPSAWRCTAWPCARPSSCSPSSGRGAVREPSGPGSDEGCWSRSCSSGLVFCLGILLALGRSERLSLTATLTRSAGRLPTSQAQRCSRAIIDSMHRRADRDRRDPARCCVRNTAGAEIVRTEPERLNNLATPSSRS